MKKLFNSILTIACMFLIGACAKIDPQFALKSESKTLTSLQVNFADGTGGFHPTTSEPYGSEITVEIPWYYPEGSYKETSLDSLFVTGTIPNSSIMMPSFGLTNLSSPKSYTLKAQNGETQAYKITAVRKKSNKAEIVSFKLKEADINGVVVNNKVFIPYTDVNLSNQTAIVELSYYAKISPDPSAAHDYSKPVKYTVTADDGTTKEFSVELGTPVKLAKGFSTVKKLWSKSSGDLGFEDYRQLSIATSGDYFVLPNSNEWVGGSSIKYYNRKTGAPAGNLNVTGVNGIYAVANDSKGKIVGINNLYAGNNVCLYVWDNVSAAPKLLARTTDWSSVAGAFYGRKVAVYGDLSANAIIMATTDGKNVGGANNVLKWTVQGGQIISQDPEVITYSKTYDYVAKAVPTGALPTSDFYFVSNSPAFMNYVSGMSKSIQYSFNSSFINNPRGNIGGAAYFEFNNAKYFAVDDASAYSSAMHIFDVTDPAKISTSTSSGDYAAFHVFDGSADYIASPSPNWNVTGDIAIGSVSADGYTMTVYFLVTNGGVVAYELSCIDPNGF
ncbi:MAG: DUF5018 domain-containing protein [Mucilaginibacter sp.]|uniref:DUF5018 domain-containing protein n=1 Tax=Mucilaginibacter sp. TaxID=1882438 RepID=UPI00356414D0